MQEVWCNQDGHQIQPGQAGQRRAAELVPEVYYKAVLGYLKGEK